MATIKKKAAKPTKSVKSTPGAVKSATTGKVEKKDIKAQAKPVTKKALTPDKKDQAKPGTKPVVAKKTAAPVKPAKNNQKTVNKKNSTPATPVKKAAPAKKAEPAKKAAPVVAKKTVAAKPVAKSPAKPEPAAKSPKPAAKAPAPAPVAPKVVAKPAPAAKVAEPVKPVAAPATPTKKVPLKKKVTLTQVPVKVNPSAPKPMATPAARSMEKKPNVIIAHRRLENKSKEPKENANTMIQYQPETYRSILDEPEQQQGPVYRYSDEDLTEFKEIISSRLEAARKELVYLQGLITRKDEAGTEDTENRYMNMEDGSGAMEREQLAQLASRQIQFINHLEKAQVRIENKTYGICRVTGKLIDKARLRAVPHATLSIEAKNTMNTKGN